MSPFTLVKPRNPNHSFSGCRRVSFFEENDEIAFTINNIHLPDDASPGENYTLNVTVDPSDMAFGDIVHEVSDNGGQQTSTNNFVISTAAADAAQLTVDPDSFEGDAGSFRGLDPIRIAFSIRNNGRSPVQPGENFTVQVLLSKDLTADTSDFVLRNLILEGPWCKPLPNESITLDWVQQLPNSFEGDFITLFVFKVHRTKPFLRRPLH